MVTLDLADTLVVSDGDGLSIDEQFAGPVGGSTVEGDRAWRSGGIDAGPDNLVARALRAVGRTARVDLVKRIPPGAGLGGGSADAAAILRWSGTTDPAVAAGLGADIPFCLVGGRAMVRGIGEDVTPLPFEEQAFTLVPAPVRDGHTAPCTPRGTGSTVRGRGSVPGSRRPCPRLGRGTGPGVRGQRSRGPRPGRGTPPRGVAGPPGRAHRPPTQAGGQRVHLVRGRDSCRAGTRGTVRGPAGLGAGPRRRGAHHAGRLSGTIGAVRAGAAVPPGGTEERGVDRRDQTGRSEEVGLTCPPPAAANGWPSASSCASSCACACGAS